MDINFIFEELLQTRSFDKALEELATLDHDQWRQLRLDHYKKIFSNQKVLSPDVLKKIVFENLSDELKEQHLQKYLEVGMINQVYELIYNYKILLIETNKPKLTTSIDSYQKRFFSKDKNILLADIILGLMRGDYKLSEQLIKDFHYTIFQDFKLRDKNQSKEELLLALKLSKEKSYLDLYRNYYELVLGRSVEKKNKSMAELVIFFDDLNFLLPLIPVFEKNTSEKLLSGFIKLLKNHPSFNAVAIEKFFPKLKSYFFEREKEKISVPEIRRSMLSLTDLRLSDENNMEDDSINDSSNESFTYSFSELSIDELSHHLQLSVMENNWPKVGAVLERIKNLDSNYIGQINFLYLNYHVLMSGKKFRLAINNCFSALELTKDENEILCFYYFIAEAYVKLKEPERAKIYLKKILLIDENYRLAKKKYNELHEH